MSSIKFWGIGDLHLSLSKPRDLTRFGERWTNHVEQITNHWHKHIAPEDVVLLVGDLSLSSTYKHAKPDLQWLAQMPGRKVMVRGNHDRWWRNVKEVRKYMLPPNCFALQGDCLEIEGVLLCGAQGHIAPQDPYYRPDPPANRYERELKTLAAGLESVKKQRQPDQPLIILMHYPPFTSTGETTAYSELIQQHAPALCLYGHLHKSYEWESAVLGERLGIEYHLLAADYLDMIPKEIFPLGK